MRCERCGGPVGNKIIRLQGVTLCENCARDLKVGEALMGPASLFGSAFPMLGDITNAIMQAGDELEFANTKIRCPKCGTTLRDVESSGQVGCIECYNVFNETILKTILKRQGSSDYLGRNPGDEIVIPEESEQMAAEDAADEENKEQQPVPEKKPAGKKKDILEKIKNADLGMVSDEDLKEAMKLAAEKEDYDLAAKFRDELNSRKGDK